MLEYGLPDYVRSDHGGENVDVWRYVIFNHNLDYSRTITGSSVHDERIERLWRDVHRCVCSTYATLFRSMESSGFLDPLNEVDRYCLHYVFKPRLNRCIEEFVGSWNNHSISSEGNLSPNQLFFEGLNAAGTLNPVNVPPHSNIDVSSDNRVTVPVLVLFHATHSYQPLMQLTHYKAVLTMVFQYSKHFFML